MGVKAKILAFLVFVAAMLPAFAATGTSNQVQISSQLCFGIQNQYPNILLQYQEPSTTTAQFVGSTTVVIPANTANNTIDTATLFPGFQTPVAFGIQEITNPSLPVNIGLDSSGARLQMAPGGFMVFRVAGGTPTFYVDNPSLTTAAVVTIVGISN